MVNSNVDALRIKSLHPTALKISRVAAALSLLAVAVCVAGCSSQRQIDEAKRRGDQIVQALKEFHADRGHYPRSLADLSPKYLQKIPSQLRFSHSAFPLRPLPPSPFFV
jgi:hypothetical protein